MRLDPAILGSSPLGELPAHADSEGWTAASQARFAP
jgi:hypothetical protein